jgi:ubiquinone/menaquinone biosynthesis C-methylase UbiE
MYNPNSQFLDNYTPSDATIEFYGRVRSIINTESIVLDLGAGRGAWLEDNSLYRIQIRSLKNVTKEFIGLDVSNDIFKNTTTTKNLLIINGIFPIEDHSVDIIICDFVFEHINDINNFYKEINRVLKKDGFLCARTPHKHHYVSLFSSIIFNSFHAKILKYSQKNRFEEDVFPAFYKLNTNSDIKKIFFNFEDYSYLYKCDPAYFFNNYFIYHFFIFLHFLLPKKYSSNILIFLKKKY